MGQGPDRLLAALLPPGPCQLLRAWHQGVLIPPSTPHNNAQRPLQITNVAALRAAGVDPVLVARRATESLLLQLLQHGLYHSDPHPGNLAVTLGAGDRVALKCVT